MKKRSRKWLFIAIGILLFPIIILSIWYQDYKKNLIDQPPFFDLFISELFFDQSDDSPWEIVANDMERPIKWQLNQAQFETLDTVVISLKNISGEKFYYVSWGEPFSRIRKNLIIFKEGMIDTIPYGGHGCSTGIYVAPLKDNETMSRTLYNPLMFNPYSNYELPIESDSFPEVFKEIYGDSVSIVFSQATYSNPWNSYDSQMIFSNSIVVSTNRIINNWKKGKYAIIP